MDLASEDNRKQHFDKLAEDAVLDIFFPQKSSFDIITQLRNVPTQGQIIPDRHNAFFGE
jgi:hypothetical protein